MSTSLLSLQCGAQRLMLICNERRHSAAEIFIVNGGYWNSVMAESSSHALTPESTRGVCVCCSSKLDANQPTFEQRLIEDRSFCPRCFAEIMNDTEYASDMRYQEYM